MKIPTLMAPAVVGILYLQQALQWHLPTIGFMNGEQIMALQAIQLFIMILVEMALIKLYHTRVHGLIRWPGRLQIITNIQSTPHILLPAVLKLISRGMWTWEGEWIWDDKSQWIISALDASMFSILKMCENLALNFKLIIQ